MNFSVSPPITVFPIPLLNLQETRFSFSLARKSSRVSEAVTTCRSANAPQSFVFIDDQMRPTHTQNQEKRFRPSAVLQHTRAMSTDVPARNSKPIFVKTVERLSTEASTARDSLYHLDQRILEKKINCERLQKSLQKKQDSLMPRIYALKKQFMHLRDQYSSKSETLDTFQQQLIQYQKHSSAVPVLL